jgi:secondary thiamine-phosphate synthase enzyme
MIITDWIELSMRGDGDIKDITPQVKSILGQSGLQDGVVTVFCSSSTSSVTTIEYEPGCVKDLRRLFDEIIDPQREYAHNARWGDGNGHSHIRASLLGPSLSIPFIKGRLALGTWQQVVFIDFDNKPRSRQLIVQVMGE